MSNLRFAQENCLVCVASPKRGTARNSSSITTEWGFISGWSRDGHGMVTPELNNFIHFDESGMNG